MDIEGSSVLRVICMPDLAEEFLPFYDFPFLIHEHFKQIGHPGSDMFFFLITADDLAPHIKLDGSSFEEIFPITGGVRNNAILQLANGEGMHQLDISFDFVCR